MSSDTVPHALIASTLVAIIADRDPETAAWLEAEVAAPPLPGTRDFTRLFAIAGRRLRGAAPAGATDLERLRALGIAAPEGWTAAQAARAALLTASAGAAGAGAPARLAAAFRTSDTAERAAILHSLVLLPDPDRFTDLAADACRSSVQPVFEAIACGNGFPATHFADPTFNQMVLKAVFTGAPLARIVGLRARITPALLRMAEDFRSERLAAGRPVPADLNRLLEPGY